MTSPPKEIDATSMGDNAALIVRGRRCGACTLCCKILRIEELAKPKGTWCRHCEAGGGCKIYEQRPSECKKFLCGFLTATELSEEWRPSKCKIVLVAELGGKRIAAHVDPSRPAAWRIEPYYSQLKAWARYAAPGRGQVVVYIGMRIIVIFPDRDAELGILEEGDLIVTKEITTPMGTRYEALKLKPDDPRAKNII